MQSCWHAWPSMAKGWQMSFFRAAILLVMLCSMFSLRSWRVSFLFSLFRPSASTTLPSWESLPCFLQAGIMMRLTAGVVHQAWETCMNCTQLILKTSPQWCKVTGVKKTSEYMLAGLHNATSLERESMHKRHCKISHLDAQRFEILYVQGRCKDDASKVFGSLFLYWGSSLLSHPCIHKDVRHQCAG